MCEMTMNMEQVLPEINFADITMPSHKFRILSAVGCYESSKFSFSDIPATQVPPLTPGTTQKMSQALLDSFKSFEKDQQRFNIPKGNYHFISELALALQKLALANFKVIITLYQGLLWLLKELEPKH